MGACLGSILIYALRVCSVVCISDLVKYKFLPGLVEGISIRFFPHNEQCDDEENRAFAENNTIWDEIKATRAGLSLCIKCLWSRHIYANSQKVSRHCECACKIATKKMKSQRNERCLYMSVTNMYKFTKKDAQIPG